MSRRANAELEKKDIILYKGDWNKLDLLLAPKRITVTQFIRQLVHNKIAQIESKSQDQHQQVEIPDVLADTDLSDLPHNERSDYVAVGAVTGRLPPRESKP